MAWRIKVPRAVRRRAAAGESISQRAVSDWSPGCMAGFFSVFLIAGLGFGLFFFIPAYKVVAARWWTAVDCRILSSAVGSHPGDDGVTYSIDVTYLYEVDGVRYTGERYEFLGGSSSGYESKKRKVDALPPGSTATCYVDPDDPSEAVLERGFSWVYLLSVLPLVFIAIGGGGVAWALVSARRAKAAQSPSTAAAAAIPVREGDPARRLAAGEPLGDRGPIDLEEQISPLGKLGCLTGIAFFWNGIVGVFVWRLWTEWRAGGGLDGCGTLFLVPFVLIGLLLLIGIPYQLLALANPRPRLRLSRSAIPLGEFAQLDWSFTGAAGRLRDLRIWVEGEESATYRRGTSSTTDTETFATLEVAERRQGMPIASGSATVRIPADTMHSFDGGRNKIVWKLKLKGSIARWPDVITEFPLVVAPGRTEER